MASKKINMNELQKMAKRADVSISTNKIESPLAKYDKLGKLSCKLCQIPVKNENWSAHIVSSDHTKIIEQLKQAKREKFYSAKPISIPVTANVPPSLPGEAPKKSILKRKTDISCITAPLSKKTKEDLPSIDNSIEKQMDTEDTKEPIATNKTDGSNDQTPSEPVEENIQKTDSILVTKDGKLVPKGFFDDPTIDAKMRGDKLPQEVFEDEWQTFQKMVVKTENMISDEMKEIEDEQINVLKQLEDIEEQMHKWSHIESLQIKVETIHSTTTPQNNNDESSQILKNTEFGQLDHELSDDQNESDADENDISLFTDNWRNKWI